MGNVAKDNPNKETLCVMLSPQMREDIAGIKEYYQARSLGQTVRWLLEGAINDFIDTHGSSPLSSQHPSPPSE